MFERIGEIARDNWECRMSFGELASELGLPSAWHAGQQVAAAWRYFNRRHDAYSCSAISRVFWAKGRC